MVTLPADRPRCNAGGPVRGPRLRTCAPTPAALTAATLLHTFLSDSDGEPWLFPFASVAFVNAESSRPQLRREGYFPYLVCRAGGWSIGLAKSEPEAVRRNEL